MVHLLLLDFGFLLIGISFEVSFHLAIKLRVGGE